MATTAKEPLRPPPRPTPSHLPENSSNLRRIAAESLMQHHQSAEQSSRATPTVSPSSCGSSMEIAPCNPATSSSSIELKGRIVEPTYSLRTSTELLKVLNRIWSLEEQHVSNASLIKALKKELDRARFHAKELAREQQGSRHEIDGMMKHITGDKLLRKNKEQERISAAVQSMREELDNQRALRNRSESLQRNLGLELYEVKTSLASISKELENERMSRGLLEDLCDELAWGLIDCEKEKQGLRQKSGEDLSERGDHDQLILRISQAWLHERMQVKQEHWPDVAEKNRTIDKLSSEIETFLQIERNSKTKIHGPVESIPLNVGASAPRDEQKFQENHGEEMLMQKELMEKLKSSDSIRALSPLRLQAKFEEHLARAMPYGGSRNQVEDVEQITVEAAKDDISEHKHESEGISKLDSNYETDNLIRNYHSFLESGMQANEDREVASFFWRSFQSPAREWTEKLPSQDLDISETPLKFLPEMKESTLRAKAVKARTRDQKSCSRQTASIYPSRDE
ncbi:hypothetical protein C2S51_033327 [Perilla frutescens var. frutescens]|nr:hypothetical protein C2S51_033327 [Perilla frutescens var. frutescens]